jgi:hypothetical protein
MSVPDWRVGRVCSQSGSRNVYFGVSGTGAPITDGSRIEPRSPPKPLHLI